MTSCAGLLRLFAAAGACSQEVTFVVQDDKPVGLEGLEVAFDDERVVSDAGVMLVATLDGRLGGCVNPAIRTQADPPLTAERGRGAVRAAV